jgi:hypothetical protein
MAERNLLPLVLSALLITAIAIAGCAPAFQDARLVAPGTMEITPSLAPILVSGEGETEHVGNMFGAHLIAGVSDRVNIGVGYARFQVADEDEGTNLIGFGPKFALAPDRAALALPFSFAFGGGIETSDSFVFSPTAFFTVPIGDRVDFNPAGKVVIPFCDDCDVLVGFNVGVGVRAAERVIIRPEMSFLFNPGEEGTVWSAGVGVSFRSR